MIRLYEIDDRRIPLVIGRVEPCLQSLGRRKHDGLSVVQPAELLAGIRGDDCKCKQRLALA